MKTLISTTIAATLIAGQALALCGPQPDRSPEGERYITHFGTGSEETLTFFGHGCDRFQYYNLTPNQLRQLSPEHCSIESYADGKKKIEEVERQIEREMEEHVDGQWSKTYVSWHGWSIPKYTYTPSHTVTTTVVDTVTGLEATRVESGCGPRRNDS